MNSETYYEQLRQVLLKKRSGAETEEMIAFIQENAAESGLTEAEYLASLGTPEQVAFILCGEEEIPVQTKDSASHKNIPPIPEDEGSNEEEKFCEQKQDKLYTLPPLFENPDFTGIRKLKIAGGSMNMKVVPGPNPGVYSSASSSVLKVVRNNDKLKISTPEAGFMNFFRMKHQTIEVCVILPEGLSLEKTEAEIVSGKLSMENLSAKSMKINQVSANLTLSNCRAEKLKIETVSGNVNMTSSQTEYARISSVSGNLKLEDSRIEEAKISTVSGSLVLEADPVLPCRIEAAVSFIHAEEPFSASLTRETVGTTLDYRPAAAASSEGIKVETVSGIVKVKPLC